MTEPQTRTKYSYDSASGCSGTYSGDLVKKVDAVGNVTCFTYDGLHRRLSVTYPSGSYASVTASKYFVYDSATVNGANMANAKGRLAEAYTCTTCPGTKLTDIGYEYTSRGEVSDVFEMTPHTSPSYYHVSQTYWVHGAPLQLSALYNGSSITGLPTISYGGTIGSTVGLDGEGRITQVTAGSGQNPVTGVIYNDGSLPTQVNFGSGDNDIFAYDSNTLRMTQFKFNVGTQSKYLNGALTWNANSSLSQLAINDQYNSSDTQTCNYTHDDLARVATANCGTAANQSFSYDAFGNISESGSPYSFQPTYTTNPPTNRFATIPGTTPSYDANGNVLSDGNHAYAWDSDGNSIAVDSVSLTFDAMDRMVEQNRSGTYTQVVYGPGGGKLALMNGSSLTKALVPLPGQATAVYTSSGLDHYRHSDWLGSARLTSSPSQSYISSVAYAPFGETYASYGTTDISFTRQNPDTVSSDYDFLYRPYSTQGRWPTPDPSGLSAVDPTNPQSWNRYPYVLNAPLAFVDPNGLDTTCLESGSGGSGYNGPSTNGFGMCTNVTPSGPDGGFYCYGGGLCPGANGVPSIYDAQYSGPPPTGQSFQSGAWQSADAFLTLQTSSVWNTPVPTGVLNYNPNQGYYGGEIDLGFVILIKAFSKNPPSTSGKSFFTDWLSKGAAGGHFSFLGKNPPGAGLYISPGPNLAVAACSTVASQVMGPWVKALQGSLKANPGQQPPSGIAGSSNLFSCGI